MAIYCFFFFNRTYNLTQVIIFFFIYNNNGYLIAGKTFQPDIVKKVSSTFNFRQYSRKLLKS